MKKNIIAVMMVTAISGAAWVAGVQASDGTVNFTWSITDEACMVSDLTQK